MTTTAQETRTYLAHFVELEKELAEQGVSALLPLRREAMAHFEGLGFPTPKHEEWKYTNLAPLTRIPFQPAGGGLNGLTPERVPFGDIARCCLVFVNGHFVPRLSTLDALPRGVKAGSLAAALDTDFDAVTAHLARYARSDDHAFVALNTALMRDGAFVHIARGAVVEEPIHLLFIATSPSAPSREEVPTVSHPRNLIVAEENSQAMLIETYSGGDGSVYFTNAVSEVVVGENSVLDHAKVQQESDAAFHLARLQVYQSRTSNFTSHNIALGGVLVRNEVHVVLDGEGNEATLNGLYVVDGQRHVDNSMLLDHAQPHCASHELYKGIMDGRATGAFTGKILVRQDAQKTDAKQTNQNLLLSKDAVIDTRPQLEIFADDVRCTHGATVGQLDEDAIFYLRTRGIGWAEARGLLVYAFASEILSRIKVASLRTRLEDLLFQRLHQVQRPTE